MEWSVKLKKNANKKILGKIYLVVAVFNSLPSLKIGYYFEEF